MTLPPTVQKEALEHAKSEFPKESCGLVTVVKGRRRYFACKNISENPDEYFVLDPEQYVEIQDKGEIISIIHSHPKTNHNPSSADLVACEKTGLPWYVVNPKTELWGYCEPSGFELPYVGRAFSYGIVDCYSLIRDFYKREFEIELSDYDRKDRWWERGVSMYLDHFADEGFKEIPLEEIEYGCVILMNLEANVPNHGGIYIGDSMVLHHVQDRLSSRDLYGGYYQKNTANVLKHEDR